MIHSKPCAFALCIFKGWTNFYICKVIIKACLFSHGKLVVDIVKYYR